MRAHEVTADPLSDALSSTEASDPPYASPPPPPYPPVPPPPPQNRAEALSTATSTTTSSSEFSVPTTIEGVRTLAKGGSWRAAATLCERLISYSHPIDVLLRLRWLNIVALLKLRQVDKAEREMTLLGDLRGEGYLYERYPTIYPNRTGSMVPKALLILQALMPSFSGKHELALTNLYDLLAIETGADARSAITLTIVNVLCILGDYLNAVAHLEQLVAIQKLGVPPATRSDENSWPKGASLAQLHSLLGNIQLQLGNLSAAEDAFNSLEFSVESPDESVAVLSSRGNLYMAQSQHPTALPQYQAACEKEPTNTITSNNAGVCQLYCCRLADAIATLDGQLKADPKGGMHEVIVSNLAALYQMKEGGSAAKAALERLVVAHASDDFDTSVLQLGV